MQYKEFNSHTPITPEFESQRDSFVSQVIKTVSNSWSEAQAIQRTWALCVSFVNRIQSII